MKKSTKDRVEAINKTLRKKGMRIAIPKKNTGKYFGENGKRTSNKPLTARELLDRGIIKPLKDRS